MRTRGLLALVVSAVLIAAGCGSSAKSGSSSSTSGGSTATANSTAAGGGTTYTLGVLGDYTGAASATSRYMDASIQAGIGVAASEGYKIKFVQADTQSTPAGALSGAQKLVEQDHVFAVVAISDLTFGAAAYLASKQIPVIGAAVDGPEWTTDRNMFSIFGTPDYSKVETTPGAFYKLIGATKVGALGYSIVPSSAESAKATAISAQVAGLQAGYVNAQFPLGGTNVGPVVLALEGDGTDGFSMEVQQNTGFAIVSALAQQGVHLKAAVFGAGYGSDLTDAGPGAEHSAQGGYFSISYEPVEMHTAATEKFERALKTYGGYSKIPGLNEYLGYVSVDAFVAGLKAAGGQPTQAQFIDAMLGISNYDAAGLWGTHSISFAMTQRGLGGPGADNCLWFTKFEGTSFQLVPGADPVCGTVIPGKSVAG